MVNFLKKLLGDPNRRIISKYQRVVVEINELEPEFESLSDTELYQSTKKFRERLADGETLDDLLPEAFAAVREASRRTIGLRHYDVQLIGGMILHSGTVAEMRTGEGKTLVATLPLYLNALAGKGVHLVTPNDYLAKYGTQWMGMIYHALGMSVSVIQSGGGRPDEASFLYDPDYTSEDDRYQYLRPITRREAYQTDITYGTNNEFGFDYLRDNMVRDLSQKTQRALHYAIIDEVDSILIDEARTPLIISGPSNESSEMYEKFAQLVKRLQRDVDYEVEEREQVALLTEEGTNKIERMLSIPAGESIYDSQHAGMLPYLDNALRAKEFFHLDKQYVVRNGEIIIIDEFTGRMMFGRRYSEGLHQAIEAKEGVKVQQESMTYATITFQNFFRMYDKLAGMTGTAETEKEELRRIYDLDVVVLPTNVEYRARYGDLREHTLPAEEAGVDFAGVLNDFASYKVTVYDGQDERYYRRLDFPDQIYKNEAGKFKAVIQEIKKVHQAGRPVLVGTAAIETSERLSRMLRVAKIPHNVLNAKYHEKEAVVIAQAGRPGTVTIATNMAGRGVDILLGGNPEGMARDALRQEGVDLLTIRSRDWDTALKMAQRGEDPTRQYPERWAEVLWDKVRQCQADREQVYRLGGLHVIGTQRHEARRIDNQLRGRAGRQGDPGSSRFFISLEDEMMRRFGGERIKPWMERAGWDEDMPMEMGMLTKLIASTQERVEGYNFDMRRHVLEYDNVVNKQRTVVYAERDKILSREDLHDDLMEMVEGEIRQVVNQHLPDDEEDWRPEELLAQLRRFTPLPREFSVADLEQMTPEELIEKCLEWADTTYWRMNRQLGEQLYHDLRQSERSLQSLAQSRDTLEQLLASQVDRKLGHETIARWYELPLRRMPDEIEAQVREVVVETFRLYLDRTLMLDELDQHWVRHLTALDMLREGIGLRAIGQQKPLIAYQKEAYDMYQEMLADVQRQIVRRLFLVQQPQPRQVSQESLRMQHAASQGAKRKPEPARSARSGTRKLGRNELCWCGSGKKYKDCHYREDKRQGIVRYVPIEKPTASKAKSRSSSRRR